MTGCQPSGQGCVARRRAFELLGIILYSLAHTLSAATFVHRPYLQNLQGDRVTILWSTRENLNGTVEYSIDGSFSQSANAQVRAFPPAVTALSLTFYQYQAELTGLVPGMEYSYRVLVNGENLTTEKEYRFRTPGPGPFRFVVFGDSGAGTPGQLQLTLGLVTETPDFVLQVGDIAYEDGTFAQFQADFFDYYFTLLRRACFYMAPGNHEYYTSNAAPYLALTAPPAQTVPAADRGRYYSFDWSNTHFVSLDSNLLDGVSAAGSRMLQWLDQDLTSSHAEWQIAFFHHLPYPVSQHVDDPISAAVRERVVPILEQHGVQLVLTGHEHSYMRSKPLRAGIPVRAGLGTVYVTTGGGGGTPHPVSPRDYLAVEAEVYHYVRVSVEGARLTIQAIGIDGKSFDDLTVVLPALRSTDAVLNAASFSPALAPEGLVSIFGQNFAAGTLQASTLPLPNDMLGATVSFNDTPIPLTYISPTQINAQLPVEARGTGMLRVSTTSGVTQTTITLLDAAPGIFATGLLHQNYSPIDSRSPARPGETLLVYGTGLGIVDGAIATGQAAPTSPLLAVHSPVEVLVDSLAVTPVFAGLAPGFVGLYQINVVLPQDLTSKVYSLRLGTNGHLSNPVSFPVQGWAP